MTANLFAEQMALHNWEPEEVTIPTLDEWLAAGGVREAHERHAAALKSAKRFVRDVSKKLYTTERDILFEALFYQAWNGRDKAAKEKQYPEPVAKFCARYDSTKSSDLTRDYIARMVGM